MLKKISQRELFSLLCNKSGAQIITITTETDPGKSLKYKNKVVKRSRVNGVINWHYQNAVNRQRQREYKEQDFKVKPRKWGTRIPLSPCIQHNGNVYLEMKVENVHGTEYFAKHGNTLIPTTKEEVSEYLKKRTNYSEAQDLDKEVILRDYKLSSIIEIRIQGEIYTVK